MAKASPKEAQEVANFFAFFNSDLPEDLRSAGAGTSVGDVDSTCATYLDDSMHGADSH